MPGPGKLFVATTMPSKECSIPKEEEGDVSEYYDMVETPENAPTEGKTGVTFKGNDAGYLDAHRIITEMTK